jgi:putative MATE family efflux protein
MQKNNVNMLSGSITKGLLLISIPIMIMSVIQSLFNIIDMTVLKLFDTDGLAVGAVGVCGTLITLSTNLVSGISAGANVLVAKRIGEGETERTNRAAGTAIVFPVVAGLALAVVGIAGAELFLSWVNCPDALFSRAVLYFRLYFAGVPVLMVYNFAAGILRSNGHSRLLMGISLAGGAVKVCSSFLFVAVCRMGILGVALATIVSWCVYAGLSVLFLLRGDGSVKLCKEHLKLYYPELLQILRVGVPTGLQMGLYSIANVIISSAVNSFGAQATTGVSIANTFDGILYSLSHATSLAILPYVSQNIGACNPERAAKSVWKGVLITVCIGAFFGALSAIFSGQLSSIMSDDPVVINYSQQKMIIISSTYFICGINDILNAALRAMGKPTFPTVTTLIFMCGLRFIWVYLIFPLVPNLTFLYLVWPIGWSASIICSLFLYVPTVKKLTKTTTSQLT